MGSAPGDMRPPRLSCHCHGRHGRHERFLLAARNTPRVTGSPVVDSLGCGLVARGDLISLDGYASIRHTSLRCTNYCCAALPMGGHGRAIRAPTLPPNPSKEALQALRGGRFAGRNPNMAGGFLAATDARNGPFDDFALDV
jgi:hypothetical protein